MLKDTRAYKVTRARGEAQWTGTVVSFEGNGERVQALGNDPIIAILAADEELDRKLEARAAAATEAE